MPVYIIAEAGVNHNGNLETAKKMALHAKLAGANAVKYQTAIPALVASVYAPKAAYQTQNTGVGETQLEMISRLHFSFDAHLELKNYCDGIGIQYLSSAFDLPSIDFLHTLKLPYDKIPSGEITNLPYLEKIAKARRKRKVLLSTGMCQISEIKAAIDVLCENGSDNITILHCNTEYPTPYKDANLFAIKELQSIFNLPVGYSDHTNGIECAVAAVALGARVIEKHFTLDKNLPGPDHKASITVNELRQLVNAVRNCEEALGSGIKQPSESEEKNIIVARKSIVAACKIKKGEIFSEENLAAKRPGSGISPMQWYDIIGKKAARKFEPDEMIEV